MTRVVLQLRMSEAEKTRLREAAESAGKTMSEYVMSCCFPDQPLKGIVHASVDEVLSCGTLKLGAASKNATMAFGLAEAPPDGPITGGRASAVFIDEFVGVADAPPIAADGLTASLPKEWFSGDVVVGDSVLRESADHPGTWAPKTVEDYVLNEDGSVIWLHGRPPDVLPDPLKKEIEKRMDEVERRTAAQFRARCPRCRREERVKGRLPEKCEVCNE